MALTSPYSSVEARQSLRNIASLSRQSPQRNPLLFSEPTTASSLITSPDTSALAQSCQQYNTSAPSPTRNATINFSTSLLEREEIESRKGEEEDYARAARIDLLLANKLRAVKEVIRNVKDAPDWNIRRWYQQSLIAARIAKNILEKSRRLEKYVPEEGISYDYYINGAEKEYKTLKNDADNASARLQEREDALAAASNAQQYEYGSFGQGERGGGCGDASSSSNQKDANSGVGDDDGTSSTFASAETDQNKRFDTGIGFNESIADVIGKMYTSSPVHGHGGGGSKPFKRQSKQEGEDERRRRRRRLMEASEAAEIERSLAQAKLQAKLKKNEEEEAIRRRLSAERREQERLAREQEDEIERQRRLSADRREEERLQKEADAENERRRLSAYRREQERLERELDDENAFQRRLSAEKKLSQLPPTQNNEAREVMEDVDLNSELGANINLNHEDESVDQIAMEILQNSDILNLIDIPGAPPNENSIQPNNGAVLLGNGVFGLIDTSKSMLDRVRNWWVGDPEASAKWWSKWKRRAIIGGLAAGAGYAAYAYANSGPIVHLHKFEQQLPQTQTGIFDPIRNFIAPSVIPSATPLATLPTIPNPVPIEISVPTINRIPNPLAAGTTPIPEINFWDWLGGTSDSNITSVTQVEIPFVNVLGAVAGGLSFVGIVRRLYHKVGESRREGERAGVVVRKRRYANK